MEQRRSSGGAEEEQRRRSGRTQEEPRGDAVAQGRVAFADRLEHRGREHWDI